MNAVRPPCYSRGGTNFSYMGPAGDAVMKCRTWTRVAAGIACSGIITGFSVGLYVLGHAGPARQRAVCEENLKRIFLAVQAYASNDPAGQFPPLAPVGGPLAVKWDALYPEHLDEPGIFTCPACKDAPQLPPDPTPADIALAMDDHCYWYLGYVVPNEHRLLTFADTCKRLLEEGGTFDSDLDDRQGALFLRLRDGIERWFVPDWSQAIRYASAIPVLIERPGNHGGGGHVLYLDGHVEFIPYPGKYPMTTASMQALCALDGVIPGASPQPALSSPGKVSVPRELTDAIMTGKTGLVFCDINKVMSVVSEDFAHPTYRDKAGLHSHLTMMLTGGYMDGTAVFTHYSFYTFNADGTWGVYPVKFTAKFGTAMLDLTFRREEDTWRVIRIKDSVSSSTAGN